MSLFFIIPERELAHFRRHDNICRLGVGLRVTDGYDVYRLFVAERLTQEEARFLADNADLVSVFTEYPDQFEDIPE